MDKIAVFGGSFNPVHAGHVLIATYTAMMGDFDRVLIIPTHVHPNGKKLLDFYHRMIMCQLAFSHIPNVIVDPIESQLPPPSFSIQTLKHLHDRHPADYRFVVGADIIHNASTWGDLDAVFRLAPPFVIGRLGFPVEKAIVDMPGISSTQVRKLLAEARFGDELGTIVPRKVLEYIQQNKLYFES